MGAFGNLWPSLEPGKLRHQINIQNQQSGQDEYGQESLAWTTICTAWASIESITLKEAFQGDVLTSQVTHRMTMRWPSAAVSIQAGMRVSYGSKQYKIQALDNLDERNIILRLLVMELNGIE